MALPVLILTGERMCGKVDVVPGVCYVVTGFDHVWLIPLLPLRSYIVLDLPAKGGRRALPVRFRWKSVFLGWLRTLLVLTVLLSGLLGALCLAIYDLAPPGALPLREVGGLCGGSALLYGLTFLFTRASKRRALELGAALGLPPDVVEKALTSKRDGRRALDAYLAAHPGALAGA